VDRSKGALVRAGILAASLLAMVAPAAAGPGPGTVGSGGRPDDNWDRGTYSACVPSTLQSGATARGAHRYCACVVAELDQLTLRQKQALTPASPEFGQAADACRPLQTDDSAPSGDADAQRDAAWDRTAYTACVPSAIGNGATSQGAARYCACLVAELDQLTLAQKSALTPNSPDIAGAASQCRPLAQAH
jgi:hypothetical protein